MKFWSFITPLNEKIGDNKMPLSIKPKTLRDISIVLILLGLIFSLIGISVFYGPPTKVKFHIEVTDKEFVDSLYDFGTIPPNSFLVIGPFKIWIKWNETMHKAWGRLLHIVWDASHTVNLYVVTSDGVDAIRRGRAPPPLDVGKSGETVFRLMLEELPIPSEYLEQRNFIEADMYVCLEPVDSTIFVDYEIYIEIYDWTGTFAKENIVDWTTYHICFIAFWSGIGMIVIGVILLIRLWKSKKSEI